MLGKWRKFHFIQESLIEPDYASNLVGIFGQYLSKISWYTFWILFKQIYTFCWGLTFLKSGGVGIGRWGLIFLGVGSDPQGNYADRHICMYLCMSDLQIQPAQRESWENSFKNPT